jgi:hypothetical protein
MDWFNLPASDRQGIKELMSLRQMKWHDPPAFGVFKITPELIYIVNIPDGRTPDQVLNDGGYAVLPSGGCTEWICSNDSVKDRMNELTKPEWKQKEETSGWFAIDILK